MTKKECVQKILSTTLDGNNAFYVVKDPACGYKPPFDFYICRRSNGDVVSSFCGYSDSEKVDRVCADLNMRARRRRVNDILRAYDKNEV